MTYLPYGGNEFRTDWFETCRLPSETACQARGLIGASAPALALTSAWALLSVNAIENFEALLACQVRHGLAQTRLKGFLNGGLSFAEPRKCRVSFGFIIVRVGEYLMERLSCVTVLLTQVYGGLARSVQRITDSLPCLGACIS